jgi:hypothetical protein
MEALSAEISKSLTDGLDKLVAEQTSARCTTASPQTP